MKKPLFRASLIVLFLLIIASFGIELHYLKHGTIPFLTRILLLLLLNVTILAFLVLVFFVSKSIIKLILERRNRVLGYKFKTKLIIILVALTLLPALSLFILSSGLIINYIDRWFAPQIKKPLEDSIEIAKTIYEIERQKTLDYARAFRAGGKISDNYHVRRFSALPLNASETVSAAFAGKEGTEIISGKRGDSIQAVIPEYNKKGRQTGVIVVETQVSPKIMKHVGNIKDAYENYLALEAWKLPIKVNYLITLGFLTLVIAFMALWVGLKISKGITDPVQSLAQATELVAAGDLDVQVQINREDEIGLLVNSFNHMVKELREGKKSLQSAYVESDRRRLFLENILDNINSGVIMLDTAGHILMINKRACSIINISPGQVLSKDYRELLALIHSEELRNVVSSIEGKEFKPFKREVKAVIRNRKLTLQVFIIGLKDAEKYIGMLVVVDDITDIIEAQKALTWQDVAKKIAHEIKNPLTPIKLSAERMLKKWEQKEADFEDVFHRSTKTIVKEVDSLKRLVDAFSKFGKMPDIRKIPSSLPALVHEVANLYRDYKGLEITITIPDNPPQVELDGEQFKRVLINIFDNAIQAMTNSGRIDVTVDFDMLSETAHVSIADNGPGIQDEDKEKLFLPYFSTKKDGTGLGLAIASRIVTEHGGHIRVQDNEPRGTVFSISIPMKES
jgi:two-component system, NtrC family, nitrogen regulation sensor histidine kinase NtrY